MSKSKKKKRDDFLKSFGAFNVHNRIYNGKQNKTALPTIKSLVKIILIQNCYHIFLAHFEETTVEL